MVKRKNKIHSDNNHTKIRKIIKIIVIEIPAEQKIEDQHHLNIDVMDRATPEVTTPKALCPQTPLELLKEFNDFIDYGVTPPSFICQSEVSKERFFETDQFNSLLLRPENTQENRLSSQDGKEHHTQDTGNNQPNITKNDLPQPITFPILIFLNTALTVTLIPSTG